MAARWKLDATEDGTTEKRGPSPSARYPIDSSSGIIPLCKSHGMMMDIPKVEIKVN